jgi:F-type H+-transporting ATPase subunit alpha
MGEKNLLERGQHAFGTFLQALDVLTPLGRGQTLLITGARQSGKTCTVLDAILGQSKSGVRCIYAAVGLR